MINKILWSEKCYHFTQFKLHPVNNFLSQLLSCYIYLHNSNQKKLLSIIGFYSWITLISRTLGIALSSNLRSYKHYLLILKSSRITEIYFLIFTWKILKFLKTATIFLVIAYSQLYIISSFKFHVFMVFSKTAWINYHYSSHFKQNLCSSFTFAA